MRSIIVRAESADVKSNSRHAYSSLPIPLQRHPRMTDRIACLLLELAGYAWGRAAVCWPSNATLARSLGKHVDTVRDIIAEAETRGFLVRLDTDHGRVFVLTWKLHVGWGEAPTPLGDLAPPGPGAKAPTQYCNGKKPEKRTGGGGRAAQGPPPPPDPNVERDVAAAAAVRAAVEQAEAAPLTAAELTEMARTVLSGGPLAGCYRAALALAGIVGDEALRALAGVSPALPEEAPKNPERGVNDQGPGATVRSPQALKSLATFPDTHGNAGKVSSVGSSPVDLCIRRGRVSRRSRLSLGGCLLGRPGVHRIVEVAATELPEENVGNQVAHVPPATDRRDGQLLDNLDGQVERCLGQRGVGTLGRRTVFLPTRPPSRVPGRLGDWGVSLLASCRLGRLGVRIDGQDHESVPSWEDGLRRPQAGATVRGLSLVVGSPARPPNSVA